MKHKILIILGFIGLTIAESCCDMRDGKAFFKISSMTFSQGYPNFDTYNFNLIFNGNEFFAKREFAFPSICNQASAFCEGGQPDGFKGAKETIDSISIVTLNDFNNNYKTNSLINNEVFILKSQSSADNSKHWYDTLSIEEFIQIKNTIKINNTNGVEFKLKSKPVDSFKIEICVKLTNGAIFKDKNSPVKFD